MLGLTYPHVGCQQTGHIFFHKWHRVSGSRQGDQQVVMEVGTPGVC